jgi:hypothetical protein
MASGPRQAAKPLPAPGAQSPEVQGHGDARLHWAARAALFGAAGGATGAFLLSAADLFGVDPAPGGNLGLLGGLVAGLGWASMAAGGWAWARGAPRRRLAWGFVLGCEATVFATFLTALALAGTPVPVAVSADPLMAVAGLLMFPVLFPLLGFPVTLLFAAGALLAGIQRRVAARRRATPRPAP